MKIIALFLSLSFIMLFSCDSRDSNSVKPSLSTQQILSKAGLRKYSTDEKVLEGSWKLSVVNYDGISYEANNLYCYSNVVWNLYGNTWQVLNFSSGCGNIPVCDVIYAPFNEWMINSGYSSNKTFHRFINGNENGVYFDEVSDCNSHRVAPMTWTTVDAYYLILYYQWGGYVIFTKN